MKARDIVGATLTTAGTIIGAYGFINTTPNLMNLGIAGVFLGLITFTFKSSDYLKKESMELMLESYRGIPKHLVKNLKLEGNAVFIPPFENLPNGGVFIPLHRDFELDPARLDEETVFLTDVPKDKEMGLFLGPLGRPLLEKYEEHFEGSLAGMGPSAVESVADSVLKYLELADRVYIEEAEDEFVVFIKPRFRCKPDNCEKVPCPVCSSVLLALSKATDQILEIKAVEETEHGIKTIARKLGGVEEWM
ncbi:hypothetical protein [Thermococcus sp.]